MLDAIAQHIDGAAPVNLALQTREELAPGRAIRSQVERLGHIGLSGPQKQRELRQIYAVFAVVSSRVAADPAGAVGGRTLVGLAGWRSAGIAGRAG